MSLGSPAWSAHQLEQPLIVYAAAGIAKLQPDWLSGAVLERISRAGLVGGPLWDGSVRLLGMGGVAVAVAATELCIVVLLFRWWLRPFGIALALGLHGALGESMVVSTFGAQMALYLMLFLPWRVGETADAARDRAASAVRGRARLFPDVERVAEWLCGERV